MTKTPTITPFANDTEALTIGGLSVENHTDRVSVFGSLDLTRDNAGLRNARSLKTVLDSVIRELESDQALPEQVNVPGPSDEPDLVSNPFV